MKRSKQYKAAAQKIEHAHQYRIEEAIQQVKQLAYAKFDETIDVAFKVDLRKGTNVRDTLVLPHSFGAEKKILVFAKGIKEQEAQEAGATYVGSDDLIAKIKGGWFDFDVAVATPDMMKDVGKLGAILGRRGLMPNPKTHTVTMDVADAIAQLKKGRVEFRSDKTGVVAISIGKKSMDDASLLENFRTAYSEVKRCRPAESKGEFLRSISISSTMGLGIFVMPDAERN